MTINGVVIAVAAVIGAGAWEQGRKMRERGRNDEKTVQRMLDENECNTFDDLTEASQFLSCIVTGIYMRCTCAQQEQGPYFQHIDQHGTHWGYEVVEFDNLAGTYDQVHEDRCRVGDLGQPKDKCVRAVLFERSDSQAPQHVWTRVDGTPDRFTPVRLPKYLFAIRGTIVPRYDDIMNDIKIAGEVLYKSEGLSVTRLLLAITRMYNPHDIWVAGHSLGAALALIATRFLAIDHGVVINPHLFNPPYLTVGRLASKAMRGVLNGVGDIGNRVLHGYGMKNTWNIRAGIDKVANKCKIPMKILSRKARQIAKSSYAENMKRDSQKLVQIGYVPHLYVNPKDTICNEYIEHFQRRHHVHNSLSSEVIQWVVPAKSVHMIPSAVMCINNWGEGPLEAHTLQQWFRYPHVNLTVERQGLTADQISTAPSEFIGSSQAQD